jgi:hypothetical protein
MICNNCIAQFDGTLASELKEQLRPDKFTKVVCPTCITVANLALDAASKVATGAIGSMIQATVREALRGSARSAREQYQFAQVETLLMGLSIHRDENSISANALAEQILDIFYPKEEVKKDGAAPQGG